MPFADAPDRVWSVRSLVPSDLRGHKRLRDGRFEPCIYTAAQRSDGFHVWQLEALTPAPQLCATPERAHEVGRAHAATRGLVYDPDVTAFDLALRLSDVVRDPAHRAQVRLGFGWQYTLLVKHTSTSRGPKHAYALAQHDCPKRDTESDEWWRGQKIYLLEKLGRVNQEQAQDLEAFAKSFGIQTLFVYYLPRSTGRPIPTRAYCR